MEQEPTSGEGCVVGSLVKRQRPLRATCAAEFGLLENGANLTLHCFLQWPAKAPLGSIRNDGNAASCHSIRRIDIILARSRAKMREAGRPTGTRAHCILLSEDDVAVRRSLQLLLRSKGFQVRSYTSATALLLDPIARDCDCLVVDYRMPDVDGIAMLTTLRNEGWDKPALLITGHYTAALADVARAAGFSDVLEKPFGEQVLVRSICRVIERSAADRGCPC